MATATLIKEDIQLYLASAVNYILRLHGNQKQLTFIYDNLIPC